MIISEYIFALLKEKGMSQKQFAELTGISQSTISDWKHKKTNPAADKIISICVALDITPYELLSVGENDKDTQSDYLLIDRQTEDYIFFDTFRKLDIKEKTRLLAYMRAMSEK
jgi:transcriptional regulator with XRE-family HTH domain